MASVSKKTCPLCKKPLSLRQINMNLAVYMCTDLKCKYPVGFDCTVIERKLEDMNKIVEAPCEEGCDLDNWLEDVAQNSEKTQSQVAAGSDKAVLGPTVEKSPDWIDVDSLIEEAVYKASNEGSQEEVETDYDDILSFME